MGEQAEVTVAVLVAFGVAAALLPPLVALLRRKALLDHPNARSSHDRPTPRGAGVAPAAGALVSLAATPTATGPARTGLMVAAAGFAALGLAEDVRGVPPLRRLALQATLAALSLVWLLDGLSGPPAWQVAFAGGCALWLVAYVNAFNFMDGINGISAAQVLVAGAAWWAVGEAEDVAALAGPAAVVAGATIAFVPFNMPTARAFLGDVGSYFLGAWLAALVVVGLRAGVAPEAVVAPLGVYLADTATTIVRRVRAGETWYLAHRDHAYQRLVRLGWSHTTTSAFVAAVMAVCSILGAASLTGSLAARVVAGAALAGVLAAYVASPRLLARRRTAGAPATAP